MKQQNTGTIEKMTDEQLREKLAAYAHDTWSGWMEYLFANSRRAISGEVIIPADLEARWKRQMKTKYEDLPESEKASDRKEANTILRIINEQ